MTLLEKLLEAAKRIKKNKFKLVSRVAKGHVKKPNTVKQNYYL